MRAAVSAVVPGAVTFNRTYRAVAAAMSYVVVLAVLPVTVVLVVQVAPSRLVWMVKSRVFQPVFSPPAPACLTTNLFTLWLAPRSTWRNLLLPREHHLSLLPPETEPLTALAGPSLPLHELSAVAGLFSARFRPGAAPSGM